jgi:hypothetical protein
MGSTGAGDRLRELVAQYTEVPQKLAADGRPSGFTFHVDFLEMAGSPKSPKL